MPLDQDETPETPFGAKLRLDLMRALRGGSLSSLCSNGLRLGGPAGRVSLELEEEE